MVKKCEDCGKLIVVDSNKQRFCGDCRVARKNGAGVRVRIKKKPEDAPIPEYEQKESASTRAKALGLTYGIYTAIMDGYLPGKEDLVRRERDLFGNKQQEERCRRGARTCEDPSGIWI